MWSEWCSWSDSPLSIPCIVAELYLFVVSVVLIRILERGSSHLLLQSTRAMNFLDICLALNSHVLLYAPQQILQYGLFYCYLFILPGSSLISCQRAKIPRVM